jgi:hypothetical protein
MAESYSTSLRLTLIGDGDLSGTWGDVTNANVGTLLEEAICGVISVPMGDTNYTLQSLNGVKDQARAAVIVATGANTAVRQVIAPLVPKLYILNNSTTGGYNVTIGGSTGAVVTVPAGQSALVYCDGTNFYNGITVAASAATTLGGGAPYQIPYQLSTSNTQFITAPTTTNSFLYWTGSSFSWSTISATLTVGSSNIYGGTPGYILYDNGGVLGNVATTGSGTVVLNNSPSFTGTPTFSTAPTVGGNALITSSGVAFLSNSGTQTFAGSINAQAFTAQGAGSSSDQKIGVSYTSGSTTYSSGLSPTSIQLGASGVGAYYDPTVSNSFRIITTFGANATFRNDGLNYQGNLNTAWYNPSDINIKTNVRPISAVLDKINALKPCHFEYKHKVGKVRTGFIAQEFETVFPGHVEEGDADENFRKFLPEGQTKIKGITQDLIPYLVQAIQELSAEVEALKAKVGT